MYRLESSTGPSGTGGAANAEGQPQPGWSPVVRADGPSRPKDGLTERRRVHTPLAKMDDELLQVGLTDQDRGAVAFRRNLLCSRERFRRAFIPLARLRPDVRNVGALAKELSEKLFETRHGARRSFPTALTSVIRRNRCDPVVVGAPCRTRTCDLLVRRHSVHAKTGPMSLLDFVPATRPYNPKRIG